MSLTCLCPRTDQACFSDSSSSAILQLWVETEAGESMKALELLCDPTEELGEDVRFGFLNSLVSSLESSEFERFLLEKEAILSSSFLPLGGFNPALR